MSNPLNPTLYNLLKLHFGEVEIKHPGLEIDWYLAAGGLTQRRDGKQRPSRRVRGSGEEYAIYCPFCKDTTRPRLHINHMWGKWDPASKSKNLFLAQCFNEQCIDSYDRQKFLYDWVFDSAAGEDARRGLMEIRPGRKEPTKVGQVSPAGVEIPIGELKRSHPNHDAIVYLEGRGFDIGWLHERYRVTYCAHSRYSLARNRIIIPMYQGEILVGWQARYIGDDVNGVSFKKAKVPKFWSCPQMARRFLAYNMEIAVQHDTILVEEGPTDVWNSGPQALGVLGKKMGHDLRVRFIALVKKYHPDKLPVVCVVLDPEQDPKEEAKGKPHHIDALVSDLRGFFGSQVFGLYLPKGSDPGSLDRTFFRSLVKKEAAKHGLKATFTRPKELLVV